MVHMLRADFVQDHHAVRFRVVRSTSDVPRYTRPPKTSVDVSRQKLLQRYDGQSIIQRNGRRLIVKIKIRAPSLVMIMGYKIRS